MVEAAQAAYQGWALRLSLIHIFAVDGDGANSPFAQALMRRIDTPGLEINKLFRQVHDDVARATRGQHEPFTYGQLSAEDFWVRAPEGAAGARESVMTR